MAMSLNANEQERINNVYNEREKALAENNSLYEGLINQAGELKNEQNQYLAEQERIQNENLDKQLNYQTDIINQQKGEAAKNKRVEENKALNDYQAYINPYGLQNERLYGAGLGRTGVSETSKLGAYSSMQNRVATGAAAYQKAIQQYDNEINAAILNNDVQKAENALNKLKLQLQNNQDYYSSVSSLSQNKLKNSQDLTARYTEQYNTVYGQIFNEQKQAEAIRQYNESLAEQRRQYDANMAYQRERDAVKDAQWQKEYELAKKNASSGGSRGGGRSYGGSGGSGIKLSGSSGSSKSNIIQKAAQNAVDAYNKYKNELYQTYTPSLSGKAKDWYNNEFNKHSYQEKDLVWVLDKALKAKKISKSDYKKIYSSYSKKK